MFKQIFKIKMSSCEKSVTTATGVFTFRNKLLTKCQAKEACAKDGQILAAVTNSRDLEALNGLAESYRYTCGISANSYHIGLDIEKCGGVETRLFTNNVVWNSEEHDHLYEWHGHPTKDINVAVYYPILKKLFIGKSDGGYGKRRFVCLSPNSTSSAQPLTEKTLHQNLNLLLASGAVMVALASIIFVLKYKKEADFEKESLKYQNEILKWENAQLKNCYS